MVLNIDEASYRGILMDVLRMSESDYRSIYREQHKHGIGVQRCRRFFHFIFDVYNFRVMTLKELKR